MKYCSICKGAITGYCGDWFLKAEGCCGEYSAHLSCYLNKMKKHVILGFHSRSRTLAIMKPKQCVEHMEKKERKQQIKLLKEALKLLQNAG